MGTQPAHVLEGIQNLVSKLENEPQLEMDEQFYIRCVNALAADRPLGMGGYGYIPRKIIKDYGQELEFEGLDLTYFIEGVRFTEFALKRLQDHEDKAPPKKKAPNK